MAEPAYGGPPAMFEPDAASDDASLLTVDAGEDAGHVRITPLYGAPALIDP
jgi:hypothetical protein